MTFLTDRTNNVLEIKIYRFGHFEGHATETFSQLPLNNCGFDFELFKNRTRIIQNT